MIEVSRSPDGEEFPLPGKDDYITEKSRVEALVREQRKLGREIVVVMGLGFVGAVMAGIVADTNDAAGNPSKFVIGMQRPSTRSYWKIPLINRGQAPIKSDDPEVDRIIRRCVIERKNLIASFSYDVLSLADVVVVDIQCDYLKESLGNCRNGTAEISALEKAFEIIGEKIDPRGLVLIETTVPPGTTENIAFPLINKGFKRRNIASEPLVAHSYERVMPGKNYVSSIRDFWRVCSGIGEEAKSRVVKFLTEILNTKQYPLTVLD
ncbi:MAG: GDP-mannose dehydrogenase, partial [Candidatus Sigynarchaeota archaeon]